MKRFPEARKGFPEVTAPRSEAERGTATELGRRAQGVEYRRGEERRGEALKTGQDRTGQDRRGQDKRGEER